MSGKTIRGAVYGLPSPEIEGITDSLASPGMLLKKTGTNTYTPADLGMKATLVAIENLSAPTSAGSTTQVSYKAGSRIYVAQMRPGDIFMLRTQLGDAIAIGDPLEVAALGGMMRPSAWTAAKAGIIIGTSMDSIAVTTLFGFVRVKII